MFIIGDENDYDGRTPWATWSLIGLNIIMFILQVQQGDRLTYGYSTVPLEITEGRDLTEPQRVTLETMVPYVDPKNPKLKSAMLKKVEVSIPQERGPSPIYLTLLTSMFMHGGILHLVMNMWFLAIFGDNVEKALRPGLFLVLYVVCGLAASAAQIASDPKSVIPSLGASGAISGVMGAYMCLFPMNKVRLLFWVGYYANVVRVPAFAALGIWFILQYVSGKQALQSPTGIGGVAYWAHIGGFVAGLVLSGVLIFLVQLFGKERPDRHTPRAALPTDDYFPPHEGKGA